MLIYENELLKTIVNNKIVKVESVLPVSPVWDEYGTILGDVIVSSEGMLAIIDGEIYQLEEK